MTTFLKTLQQDIEVLYRSVFESTLEGMEIIDGETCRVVTANQAMANIFGFASPEEMVGLNPLDYIPTEDRDRVARMIDEDMFQNNLRLVIELRAMTRDGKEIWLSALGVRIEHQGRLAGLISVRDITSQKLRERKIEASKEETRLLVENAGKAIVVIQDGVLKFANSRTVEITGYPEKDLVSRPFTEFIHPDDKPTVAELYLRSLKGEEAPHGSVVRSIGKEGEVIWFGLKAVSFTWEEKPAVWLLMNDITERKKAEEALQHQEQHFRALVENSSDALIVLNPDGTTRYVSPSLKRMLGEGRVGAGMTEAVHPDDIQLVADSFASLLQNPGATSLTEVRIRHKDGSWHTTESTATNLLHDPSVEGIVVNLRDITERKKVQQDLEQSEKKYRQLVETINEGIWSIDKDSNTTFVNPRMAEMLGYTIEEMMGKHLFAFMDERGVEVAKYNLEHRQQGVKEQHDFEFLRKDGTRIYAVLETSPIIDDKGEYAGAIAGVQDITKRRTAEQALAESEKRYRFMAENVSDVIWVIDMNLKPTYLSPSITKLTGYSLEETLARGMEKGLTPTTLEAVAEIVMAELARKGEPNSATRLTPVAVEMERKDGTKIWAESAGTLLRGPDAQPVEIIGILRDITERKKADEALQRKEEHFRALTEHSSDVILVVSAEGTVRYVTPSVEPLLGFNPEEALGTSILEYIDQDAIQPASDEFAKLLQNPGATMQTEIRIQHKDGTWRTLEGIATNLLHDPAVEGIVINYRDITDRKKAEEIILESARRNRLLAGSAADIIWTTDANLRVTYVSPSVTTLFGYSVEEAMAGGLAQGMSPATLEAVAADLAEALAQEGKPNETTELPPQELELKCKDGSQVWAWVRSVVTRGPDGQPSEIIGVLHDITKRKQMEEALRQSEQQWKGIFDHTLDGMVIFDPESGKAVLANQAVADIFGFATVERAVGTTSLDHIPEEDREHVMREIAEGMAGGLKKVRDIRIRTEDGRMVWVSVMPTITNYQGIPAILMSIRDITDRRQVEEAVRDSESRYRLLAENLSDVIWTMDTNLKYTYVSPSVTRLRGYTVEEAKTISMENMMTPASLEAAMRVMAEEDAKEHTGQYDPNRTVTMEAELYRKDGSTVWVENKISYLRDAEGRLTGYQGVSRDIAERREATKRLEQSFQNLEKAMDGSVQAIALTVESRDRYTAGHQKRVAQLGCAIAQKLGYTSDQIRGIRIAALLHDIGKISVPQEILSKPGKLTDAEFRLIKAHSQTGYDILKSVEFPWPIADIVIQHHERMNGSGYPSGIREDKLLMEARILAVADVVEAMSSHRPYRPPLGVDKALEEVSRNSGSLYDPGVVDACMWVFNEKGFEFED